MDRIEVQFLGTGDAFGSGGRLQACIHVQMRELRFLMDCGASALIGMKRFGVDPALIDMIFLSHLHGDHFAGIPFLILDGQFSRRTRPLQIVGPPGVENRIRESMEIFFPGSSQVQRKFKVEFAELKEGITSSFMQLACYALRGHPPQRVPCLCIAGEVRAERDRLLRRYGVDGSFNRGGPGCRPLHQ